MEVSRNRITAAAAAAAGQSEPDGYYVWILLFARWS